MNNRRTFLKKSLAATAAVGLTQNAFATSEKADKTIAKEAKLISTWNHGIEANNEGWRVLADGGTILDAIEKGLTANPDAETRGTLLINKALTLHGQGDQQSARAILNDLVVDPTATLNSEALAKQLLPMVSESPH